MSGEEGRALMACEYVEGLDAGSVLRVSDLRREVARVMFSSYDCLDEAYWKGDDEGVAAFRTTIATLHTLCDLVGIGSPVMSVSEEELLEALGEPEACAEEVPGVYERTWASRRLASAAPRARDGEDALALISVALGLPDGAPPSEVVARLALLVRPTVPEADGEALRAEVRRLQRERDEALRDAARARGRRDY